jgi:hypothetical protein
MKTKFKWLERRISAPGPYLCLCLSEQEYEQALKHCRVVTDGPWLSTPQCNATTHILRAPQGLCAVICLVHYEKRQPIEIAGLLVHEAVHVWQDWYDYYGERAPGTEQEAYAIQSISQELMAEFARRVAA